MSVHKSHWIPDDLIKIAEKNNQVTDPWLCSFPNVADFNFNYCTLMDRARENGIAANSTPEHRVAVIGLGVAGLLSARELYRSGYNKIDMYEATERISGRTYSVPAKGQSTTFEMGAMRMPFFTKPGSNQCVLDHLRQAFDIAIQDFPDPGSNAANTGIYINDGYGPDANNPFPEPQLIRWDTEGKSPTPPPPNEKLKEVYDLWNKFATLFTDTASTLYGTPAWDGFWKSFVQYYWDMNFRELVLLSTIDEYDPTIPGYVGGLGMNQQQADLFYTIGAGDGSWGAFYQIGCLYPIRTLLFGFAKNHQLIQGRFDSEGDFIGGNNAGEAVTDSLGKLFESPTYLGVQSFGECLLFEPVKSQNKTADGSSLYQAVHNASEDINLYTQTKVNKLIKNSDGSITVQAGEQQATYDSVILTIPTWAMQLSIEFEGFSAQELPFEVQSGLKSSHWITSCKVFYGLKERYWENSDIPQLLATDTYLQGVYGYAADIKNSKGEIVKKDPGVLLVSYTWEDDANKFLPNLDDKSLAKLCLNKFESILQSCANVSDSISQFVDLDEPQVIHWSQQPDYRGCAKLYRQGTWDDNYQLLAFNQNYSKQSGLYFAGEAFSLEGGWTEPALRTALDSVLYLVRNNNGEFLNGFNFEEKYPRHEDWCPQIPSEQMHDKTTKITKYPV